MLCARLVQIYDDAELYASDMQSLIMKIYAAAMPTGVP
jgi:hypothetical protein